VVPNDLFTKWRECRLLLFRNCLTGLLCLEASHRCRFLGKATDQLVDRLSRVACIFVLPVPAAPESLYIDQDVVPVGHAIERRQGANTVDDARTAASFECGLEPGYLQVWDVATAVLQYKVVKRDHDPT